MQRAPGTMPGAFVSACLSRTCAFKEGRKYVAGRQTERLQEWEMGAMT